MKFKNIKKKIYKKKSPSNSRANPEYFKFLLPKANHVKLFKIYKKVLEIFLAFIFIVAVIIIGLDFQSNLKIKQDIDLQRGAATEDLKFWEDFISKHQNYPDAYFQASILEYRLGDSSKAKIYVEKGLMLDPNSENGKKLQQLLK